MHFKSVILLHFRELWSKAKRRLTSFLSLFLPINLGKRRQQPGFMCCTRNQGQGLNDVNNGRLLLE